ncbi:hypothetical protein Z043_109889 [Scleropages formosus]|uniref:Uncharacterized protein n=1 Tax=Scleropages formosus TaxID=113540 RepID=A0A0P7X3G4_SCLFO|nr:hypothetical protein Z043_109889 [Scleropages formosus]
MEGTKRTMSQIDGSDAASKMHPGLSSQARDVVMVPWCPSCAGFRVARMGNLIKVLTRDIDSNAGNFFLDFESKCPFPP